MSKWWTIAKLVWVVVKAVKPIKHAEKIEQVGGVIEAAIAGKVGK